MKKATLDFSKSSPSQAKHNTTQRKRKTKLASILEHFANGGSLNRFEAERLGDHCLNSTVSVLANDYGLAFFRLTETVPNRFGGTTPVTRYRLMPSDLDRAQQLLEALSAKAA
jgi:hypothetical protein